MGTTRSQLNCELNYYIGTTLPNNNANDMEYLSKLQWRTGAYTTTRSAPEIWRTKDPTFGPLLRSVDGEEFVVIGRSRTPLDLKLHQRTTVPLAKDLDSQNARIRQNQKKFEQLEDRGAQSQTTLTQNSNCWAARGSFGTVTFDQVCTIMMVMPVPTQSNIDNDVTMMEVVKRRNRESSDGSQDEFSSGMDVTPSKRQKLPNGKSVPDHIGENELASAFALASLASMSPKRSPAPASPTAYSMVPESREEEVEFHTPGGPDVRSPVRSPNQFKKVTFSNDTRDITRQGARRFSLPPRSRRSPPRHNMMPPVAPWLRPRLMDHNHPGGYAMPMPPPDKWICDYCNVAAFDSYQEACAHEETCRVQYHHHHHRQPPHHGHWSVMPHSRVAFPRQRAHGEPQRMAPPAPPMPRSPVPSPSSMGPPPPVPVSTSSRSWFDGSTSLSIPSTDSEWLSTLNCFIRGECVEAFSATEDDVAKVSKRGRITSQQVGIRCCFCKHRPKDEALSAATSYPVSMAGIYESVKRWQKFHLEVCQDIPPTTRAKLQELASSNSWVPTTRQYWADSAKALGMVDTQDGIRFGADPSDVRVRQAFEEKLREASSGKTDAHSKVEEMHKEGTLANGESIVYTEDMAMVPPYVFFLMRQVEATHFTESDRFVARSKGPVGYVS